MADGCATLQAFELDGVKYLSGLFALDSKDLGQPGADDTVPVWKHIASLGEYKGHPSGGFAFTAEAFDQIIKNFEARTTPLNVDYEHQTFNRSLKGAIDSAGWIVQLELREDGDELWALLNLLPDAAQRVRARKLRCCSPVIIPEAADRKTADDIGFELRSLALTNDPFLDGLHPFQLTRIIAMTEDEQKKADAASAAKAAEDKSKDDEAKKLAEPAEPVEGGGAADALIAALADASGSDIDTVLAVLGENQDMLVKAIQDAIEKGGTPAESTDNRQMRMMTIHVGPVLAPATDGKTLSIALKHKDSQIRTLSEQLSVATTKLDGYAKARAAAEGAALQAKVKSLQDQGFVGKDAQAFNDALEMFRDKPELAERIYSMATPPVGLVGDQTDPLAESGRDGKPLLMSALTEAQRASYDVMRKMGKDEKFALAFLAKSSRVIN